MRLSSALGTEKPMCRGGQSAAESPPYSLLLFTFLPRRSPSSPPHLLTLLSLAANQLTSHYLIWTLSSICQIRLKSKNWSILFLSVKPFVFVQRKKQNKSTKIKTPVFKDLWLKTPMISSLWHRRANHREARRQQLNRWTKFWGYPDFIILFIDWIMNLKLVNTAHRCGAHILVDNVTETERNWDVPVIFLCQRSSIDLFGKRVHSGRIWEAELYNKLNISSLIFDYLNSSLNSELHRRSKIKFSCSCKWLSSF